MKKLLVKIKVIDIPYSPLIPSQPEKWVKDEEVLFEEPKIEVTIDIPEKWVKGEEEVFSEPQDLTDWVHVSASQVIELQTNPEYTHHEFVPEVPEQLEVSHEEIIAQTQGEEAELQVWLDGDKHKYPEEYWVEYVDISAQVEQEKINAEALEYLASTDWLIVREVETQVPCPQEIKQLRSEARLKVVR